MDIRALLLLLLVTLSSCVKDPPDSPDRQTPVVIDSKVLTENLSHPWEILWGPDNFIWMTERSGKISRVDPSNGNVTTISQINDVVATGEGGLLGMVLHPQFNETPQVFVAYDYQKSSTYTGKVVRYDYTNGQLIDPVILVDDLAAASIHNGCRLVISKDNKLFITTGDAANQTLPQNATSRNGKVLRINLDGTIPEDNPDPSSAVWSLGHRNAQGMVFVNDSLFASEHGPDSDDEVNIIHKGGNYGWPDVKGLCDAAEQDFCAENNVVEPVIKWTPTIAVCGIDYYNKDLIPQWKNSILMCTLKASKLVQLQLDGSQKTVTGSQDLLTDVYGRLRDICISPEGKVYVCTSNGNNDKIIEIGVTQ